MESNNLTVFGAQWGDEGKGKVVDFYSERADIVVRFGGGNNAGHTIVADGQSIAVHLLPSGAARPDKVCVLGDGMVVDAAALLGEMARMAEAGRPLSPERLRLSARAQLVLPHHRLLDQLREGRAGALGTTRRGIGPAYEDKAARRGLRVGDLLHPTRLRARLREALREAGARIMELGGDPPRFDAVLSELLEQAEKLEPFIGDTGAYLADAAASGRRLLFEGAQGVLLDIDHGTYPFVTSSHTLPAGACTGAGVGPGLLGTLVGVAKAYSTRVGEGPFPTEIAGEAGERLRAAGGEFGTTTGRPRRCGWLDLPALRYVVRVSGMQSLALTKLDVLGGVDGVKVCEAYRIGGRILDEFPADPEDLSAVEPVYREVEGFEPLDAALRPRSGQRSLEALPAGARSYVSMIERELGVGICLVSVGATRDATMVCRDLTDPGTP